MLNFIKKWIIDRQISEQRQIVEDVYYMSVALADDISLFQICSLLTTWEIPDNKNSKEFLKKIDGVILSKSFASKKATDFYSALWFKAKYNHPQDLLDFLKKYKNLWLSDSFLRRQVTAIFSRLLSLDKEEVADWLRAQISSGVPNTVTIANQIMAFSEIEVLDKKLNSYLFPEKKQRPYPLQKFMVLCSVLNSEKIRTNTSIKQKILEHIKDVYYLKWLEQQYNIS